MILNSVESTKFGDICLLTDFVILAGDMTHYLWCPRLSPIQSQHKCSGMKISIVVTAVMVEYAKILPPRVLRDVD